MHWQYTPVALLYAAACLLSWAVAVRAWRQHPARGARLLALLAFATGIWTLGYLLTFFNADLGWRLATLRLEFLGIAATPLLWFLFTLAYTHYQRWLTRNTVIILSIVPAAQMVLAAGLEHHDLIFRSYTLTTAPDGFVTADITYGPYFWFATAYSYLLALAGTVFLLQAVLRFPALYRGQANTLTTAALIPMLANILFLAGLNPLGVYDPTPIAFAISGLFILGAMRQFRFLSIVPVAHDLVFQSIQDGVLICDPQANILDLNPAAARILGVEQAEAPGMRLADLLPAGADLVRYRDARDVISAEIALGQDEAERVYALQLSPLYERSGRLTGRVFLLSDITQLKEIDRLKSELVAKVAHELKHPLGLITGYVDVIRDDKLTTGPGAEYIDRALAAALNMRQLIDDLLDVARIEAGLSYEFAPADAGRCVREVVGDLQETAGRKEIALTVEVPDRPATVFVDYRRMCQVLTNLVDNAIKYTPEGGWVKVRVEPRQSGVSIAVEDNGIGIALDDMPHIFEKFYRVHSDETRGIEGTGLGLSIVELLVRAHGGTLTVTSELGQGSTFAFKLPYPPGQGQG